MSSGAVAEDWEVVDIDGFIIKRRKKQSIDDPTTLAICKEPVLAEQVEPSAQDVLAQEALGRRKKMTMLLAQKAIYATEIRDWELLLNNQKDLLSKQKEALACALGPESPTSSLEHLNGRLHNMDDAISKDNIEAFRILVEAYEGFVKQINFLHQEGESLCRQLEEDVKVDLLKVVENLQTPRTIFHALTAKPVIGSP